MQIQNVTLIGLGAIGTSVFERMQTHESVHITHVVVSESRLADTQQYLGTRAVAVSAVPSDATLVLECAGHRALMEHVLPALERGIECAVLSIGALSALGLPEQLEAASRRGDTHLHLLAGAIGGIDAVAAARQGGLDKVIYTGRKPPQSWQGSPAEQVVNLQTLREPAVILESNAREAARLYPKNTNVVAALSLAGLGLDKTQVRLIADPGVTENVHEFEVYGAFGHMSVKMSGRPLADNPKTSALTVLSALRFLHNRTAALTI